MYGNSLFYPGTYVFVNPYGLGKDLGSPVDCSSLSSIMGLGGYHVVYKVKNYIEAGKYETTVSARFSTSGGSNEGCVREQIG